MRCLRSGYCCIQYDVVIVSDPKLGITPDNLEHKPCGKVCKHLLGTQAGEHSCAIHDEPWYPETPCYAFTQIEDRDSPCRVGKHILSKGVNYAATEHN